MATPLLLRYGLGRALLVLGGVGCVKEPAPLKPAEVLFTWKKYFTLTG